MGQTRSLCFLLSFSQYNDNIVQSFAIKVKSVDGVLGIQAWDRRMVGADESTGDHPNQCIVVLVFYQLLFSV